MTQASRSTRATRQPATSASRSVQAWKLQDAKAHFS
jgi:hypothetical protein